MCGGGRGGNECRGVIYTSPWLLSGVGERQEVEVGAEGVKRGERERGGGRVREGERGGRVREGERGKDREKERERKEKKC